MYGVHDVAMRSTSGVLVVIALLFAIVVGAYLFFVRTVPKSTETPPETPFTPVARILFPSGEETLLRGGTYTVLWSGTSTEGTATTTQLFLINTALESEGASASISDRVYNIPDSGSFRYTIPTSTATGTYRFMIGKLLSNIFRIATSTP